MSAWLIGLLVAAAVLGLGYAAVDALATVWRAGAALVQGTGQAGRIRAVLRAYRPPMTADRIVLPPALLQPRGGPAAAGAAAAAAGCRRSAAGRPRRATLLLSPYLAVLGAGTTLYLAYRQTLMPARG